MRFLRSFAGLLAAVMFVLSAVSGVSFADGNSSATVFDPETMLEYTLLEDGAYSVQHNWDPYKDDVQIGEFTFPSEYNGKKISTIGYLGLRGAKNLTSLIIPEGITTIEHDAFVRCTSLTTVKIPASVSSIGNTVFSECPNLVSVNVDKDNKYYCSEYGALFNKDKTELILYPIAKKIETYTVPNTVTAIGNEAFTYHSELVSIELPDNLVSIRRGSFGCEALVKDRAAFSRKYPMLMVERTTLEDIMLFVGKGEEK